MALLHTQTLSPSSRQDQISIFNTSTWECAITFALSTQRARQVVFFVILETLIQQVVWCNDGLHLAICDHALFNTVFLYTCDGQECYQLKGVGDYLSLHSHSYLQNTSLLGPCSLYQGSTLPVLCAAGYESQWHFIDTIGRTTLSSVFLAEDLKDSISVGQ